MRRKIPHWIQRTHVFRADEYECSVCAFRADRPYAECPACGTPMEGRDEYDPSWVDEMEIMDALFDD